METNDKEHNGTVPAILDDQLVAVAEQAEKRIEAVKKMKSLALAVTNAYDWTDQNGKPYLQCSGGEKVARLFGVNWRIDPPERQVHEDGHFTYKYKGRFELRSTIIEVVGSRCSRDGFFTRRYKDDKPYDLPASEVDEGNVMKAAYTNCIGNGVTRLLGIRNMTWEEIERFAKFKKSDVTSIQYKKHGDRGSVTSPPKTGSSGKMTDKQGKAIYAIGKNDFDMSDTEINTFKEWALGKNPTSQIASEVIKNFAAKFDKWTKQQDADTEPPSE